jgi:diguanylate cyclase (GGDEF)-like protein/PAS domain S-box-containing protein
VESWGPCLELALGQATEVITVVSADNRVVFQSPAVERLLGYRVDELHDTGLSALIHPDDVGAALAGLAHTLMAPDETARVVCRLRHRDGSWVRVECTATNLLHDPDVEGVVLRTRAIADDDRDDLTGLGDRAAFEEHLVAALKKAAGAAGPRVAVLVIDLDRFALVNKSLGRAGGDAVLREVATRLSGVLRRHDYLARIGGDEFAILADVGERADAVRVARRVMAAFDRPVVVAAADAYLTVTVGVAVDTGDGDALWDAQVALGRAKRGGGARWDVADDRRASSATSHLHTATALRRALDGDELRLVYQPIVDLWSGTLVSAEALMRWARPDREELVGPGEFIAVAEDTGLIRPMGAWALHEACRQAQEWRVASGLPITVSVNLAPRQVRERALIGTVAAALDASGLDPDGLIVEITEDVALDGDDCLHVIDAVRRFGVRVSVDDFGAGYAGVAYLRRFPVDIVKIDRSLVSGACAQAADAAIIDGIVHMAHGLGLTTVAEGLETDDDLQTVRSLGCRLGQGFLLGRPGDAGGIAALLAREPAGALRA